MNSLGSEAVLAGVLACAVCGQQSPLGSELQHCHGSMNRGPESRSTLRRYDSKAFRIFPTRLTFLLDRLLPRSGFLFDRLRDPGPAVGPIQRTLLFEGPRLLAVDINRFVMLLMIHLLLFLILSFSCPI